MTIRQKIDHNKINMNNNFKNTSQMRITWEKNGIHCKDSC